MNQLFLNFEVYANFSAAIIVEPIATFEKTKKEKKPKLYPCKNVTHRKNVETPELRNTSPQEVQVLRF